MGLSPRAAFLAAIKPHVPKAWKVIPYMDNLDNIDRTTLVFHMTAIEKSTAAPLAAWDIDFTVYVISPQEDAEKSEDDTDDSFVEFVSSLDKAGIPWTRAEKGPFSETVRNLAYKFTIPLIANKES